MSRRSAGSDFDAEALLRLSAVSLRNVSGDDVVLPLLAPKDVLIKAEDPSNDPLQGLSNGHSQDASATVYPRIHTEGAGGGKLSSESNGAPRIIVTEGKLAASTLKSLIASNLTEQDEPVIGEYKRKVSPGM